MAAIYKRGSTWWARATRAGREHRQSLKTRDRGVAEKRLARWLEELDAQGWGERPRVPFGEAVRAFITEHLPQLKPQAARRYGVSLKWLNDRFGDLYLDEIGRDELAGFESWRRGMRPRASPRATVSSGSIRRDLSCLSSLMSFAEDREWLKDGHNPVTGYLRRRSRRGLKEAPARQRYLSELEEERLAAAAAPHVRDAVMLAIDTGLREQELFSLKWPQVDLRRRVITTTSDTKSGRMRTVPLAQRSAQLLEAWKAAQTGGVAPLFVFSHEDGSRYRNLTKGFKAAARRAGVADVRWHDLRRTAGCRWRQRDGLSLEQISILLGHSSYAQTEKAYAFLENEKIAEALVEAQRAGEAG